MTVPLLRQLLPGLALAAAVAGLGAAGEQIQAHVLGRAPLEALVVSILVGTIVRTLWTPGDRFRAGIGFSAKTLLEVAVVLLGLSISAGAVLKAGPVLLGGIALVVACAIAVSYAIGRGFGLSRTMALLVACGNSICGNSAIAATAPVIHADSDDVAASIAFTAVLGVAVVLGLPLLASLLHLSPAQYGVFAGLTVYAVPQVIAATAPLGTLSVQIGTLVKLVRVLMLGPVLLVLSLGPWGGADRSPQRFNLGKVVPPFILGFLVMIAVRSTGSVPAPVLAWASMAASALTTMAMAALGLSVDLRSVARAGLRVTAVVVLSLLALGGMSLGFVALLGSA